MKRKFTFLIAAAFMLLTMMASTGTMWGQSDYSETYSSNVTLPTSGTQASGCAVVIGGTNYSGTKLGKNGAGGSASITAPAGTKYIHLHVAAWNGKSTGFTYKIGSGTAQSISGITSNSGIANNTPFTWGTGTNDKTPNSTYHYKVITLSSALTEATSITFASTSERVVFWGVNTEEAGSNPSISADDVEIAYNATSGSIVYEIENGEGNVTASITTGGDWLTSLGTITATEVPFTCSTNEGAAVRTATVTLSFTGASNKVVTITQAGNPDAPGTQNNPYTVAQARAAIDAGTGVTGVYATGIVSAIPTAWSTQYNNITFNIVDESGDEDFLQAFRCVSTTSADASTVAVGDIVVVYGNMLLYQSTTYEFAQGCQLISLEHPSTPYFTANDVNITYDATGGNIEYTVENPVQGGQVTATTTSTWLTLSNNFASPIAFTCEANNAANSRTATVTLTYTYGTKTTVAKDVTVTQAAQEAPHYTWDLSIASYDEITDPDIVTWSSNYATMTNSSKSGGTSASNYLGGDSNNRTSSRFYSGNTLTITPATGYLINSIVFTATSESYASAFAGSTWTNATATASGKTVTVTATNGTNAIVAAISGTCGFTAVTVYYAINTTPLITLAQYEYDINVYGGDNELPVTYINMPADPQSVVIFYEANGETPLTENPSWITAVINDNYNIDGHIDANSGDARSAYFKVKGIDANSNEVYSNLVTINQAAAGPNIEFNNTSMTLEAGGESDRKLSFDYSGLGNNPTFSINYYEQDGTTAATYNHDWLTATISDSKLNVTAEANDGGVRTVYLKVYGEGNNTNAESNLVTITQAANVVDYAILPFEWEGGLPTAFEELNGTTLYSVDSYPNQTTYQMKLDSDGDYIQVKTNEQPGVVTVGVKMVGGNTTSTLTVQGSADGETFTNIEALTISGKQNDILNLETTNDFAATDRYVRLLFTKGSNVGVGPITIAQVDNTPSITAEDVNIAYDATGGSIMYMINNYVAGTMTASTEADWISNFTYEQVNEIGEVEFTTTVNNGSERQATVTLTYTYNNDQTAVKNVTVTQAGIPVVTYVVNFNLDDGTFVPNEDFPQDVVEKEAGTYTLPSATKVGYDFTGWNDGNTTYEAGAEYTVSSDVDFTAQWTESTTTTGTIAFGSAEGSTPINNTSVTGDDSLGNEWTITTIFSGETSFTQNANYSQVGASSKPASSITFTMTLPQQKIISAFEAKFGGFNGTAGDITLKVGNTTVGSGELDATNDVTVNATTTTEIGTVLTVTVTNIAKGVKCYYISYTLSNAPVVPVISPTANPIAYNATTGSIDYTIDNYEEGTMTAASEADWISNINVEEADEIGIVTFNVTANTSNESRSATVTLTFTYGNPAATVTKDVTVTQNGQPSITVTPATANVAFAGSAPEFAVTYESLEIDDADDFDVEFYETSTSTTAGTQPTWITNVVITGNTTDGFTLTFTVAANDGAARDAYLKVYAAGDSDYIYSNIVTISQAAYTQLATYSLVTSVDQIVSGKHYLIASSATNGSAYAMGGQTSNNRSGVAVTIENGQISETEGVYEFVINTHETSSKDVEYYTIYDAAKPGYLYASSSSANQLKTTTTLNDNGKWTIEISDNSATITAQGTNSRKLMRYNPNNNSPIFACYATNTTTGNAPCLYVKDNDDNLEYYGTEITYPGTSIPDGGSITVGSGSVITVPNGFTNNSPDNILIEEGGQLIHESDVAATVQKNITAYTAKDGDGWYLIATPVETIDKSVVAGTNYDLFLYSEPDAMWYAHWDNPGFEELYRGQGYLYANAADKIINYAGTMKATNANINIDLDYTSTLSDAVRGFNLVGNPFTCNLKLGDMKLGGANLTTYYVTNTDRTALQAITSDAYQIKPGEGFFVQATAASQQLSFNASSKDDIDFRYIKIVAGNENGYDNAYIQMGDCNTLRKMNIANKTEVYVMDGEDDYAAARVEELAGSMPVHFKAIADGEYTITIEAKYTDVYYMHLFDNFTGEDIDLMLEPSYTFHAAAEDAENRFLLVFDFNNHLSVNENYTNDVFAYQYGDEIIINGEGELQIFDVMGRMVLNTKVNGVQSFNVPSNGVYILRIIGNDIKTQKIVVK
jgi:hypothetical protein